jgi:hypothetical protein
MRSSRTRSTPSRKSDRWPCPGSRRAAAPGIAPASHRPCANGTIRSSPPCQTNAGTAISSRAKPQERTKARSSSIQPSAPGRSASAKSAAIRPPWPRRDAVGQPRSRGQRVRTPAGPADRHASRRIQVVEQRCDVLRHVRHGTPGLARGRSVSGAGEGHEPQPARVRGGLSPGELHERAGRAVVQDQRDTPLRSGDLGVEPSAVGKVKDHHGRQYARRRPLTAG